MSSFSAWKAQRVARAQRTFSATAQSRFERIEACGELFVTAAEKVIGKESREVLDQPVSL